MSAATATPERTAAPGRTSWKLDPAHTSVEFSAKHLMITTVRGRISEVEGTILIDDKNPASSSVDAILKATSLDTRSEQRDAHLRSADFLDTEKYPVITFKSKRIDGSKEAFKLTGDLTIHGTTKETTLDVTFEGSQKDPWGGDRVGFSASGKIDRRDFGLTWNQVLEAGGVTVSNDIKINIEAQATKEA